MGYLDNTGLQYLWNRLKEKFAPKSHTHTKTEVGLGNVDNTADKDKRVASAAKLTTTRTVSGGTDIVMDFKYDGLETLLLILDSMVVPLPWRIRTIIHTIVLQRLEK